MVVSHAPAGFQPMDNPLRVVGLLLKWIGEPGAQSNRHFDPRNVWGGGGGGLGLPLTPNDRPSPPPGKYLNGQTPIEDGGPPPWTPPPPKGGLKSTEVKSSKT